MNRRRFILRDTRVRDYAASEIARLSTAEPVEVVVQPYRPTRSLEQNAMLWSLLSAVSEQVDWYGRKLSPESWKDVFSAALRKQDVVPSLNGDGFVVLGTSTRKMTTREMSDLLDLIQAFAVERNVELEQAA